MIKLKIENVVKGPKGFFISTKLEKSLEYKVPFTRKFSRNTKKTKPVLDLRYVCTNINLKFKKHDTTLNTNVRNLWLIDSRRSKGLETPISSVCF